MKRHFIVMAVILAACTPTQTEEPPRATTTTTTSEAPSTTATTVPAPFEYRVGITDDVTTLNPWALGRQDLPAATGYVLWRTATSLYRAQTEEIGVSAVSAATSMPEPVETDAGTWTVELGTQGTWSDGEPVTPADVAFTFDTVRRLELGDTWAQWFPAIVTSVVADGDVLTISFEERPGLSVWPFAVGMAPIIPAHHWEPLVEDLEDSEAMFGLDGSDAPTGGPFRLVERVPGEETRMEPHEGWPGWEAPPAIASLTYAAYEDEDDAIDALEIGEVDAVIDSDGIAVELANSFSDPNIGRLVGPSNGFRFIAFNFEKSVTNRRAFREAVALAAGGAVGPPASLEGGGVTISSGNLPWYDGERAGDLTAVPEDWVAEAVTTLGEAGFAWEQEPDAGTPGSGLSFNEKPVRSLEILVPEEDADRREYVAAIAENMAHLGFDITETVLPLEEVVQRVFTPNGDGFDFDMFAAGWTLGAPEFPRHYSAFFGTPSATSGQNNNTGFSDEELESLIEELDATRDTERALEIVWDIEAILRNQRPYVILYSESVIEVYRLDRVRFPFATVLGGLQAMGGAPEFVEPAR